MLSRNCRDHIDKPWPGREAISTALATVTSRIGLACIQSSVVRLGVQIQLYHLAPASRLEYAKDISDVASPSIRVDATSHHLRVYDVEMVRIKGKSAEDHDECYSDTPSKRVVAHQPAVEIINLHFEIVWWIIWDHLGADFDAQHLNVAWVSKGTIFPCRQTPSVTLEPALYLSIAVDRRQPSDPGLGGMRSFCHGVNQPLKGASRADGLKGHPDQTHLG